MLKPVKKKKGLIFNRCISLQQNTLRVYWSIFFKRKHFKKKKII